jgi:ABC-type phosphate transport system, periplasmic component
MKIKHVALSLALVAAGMASAHADRLVIKGSDTLGAKLVPQLAEQFKAQHPGTTFDIAAEGSTTGIAAIIDGTAQIGMSSRRAQSSEVGAAVAKGKHMKPTIVAFDGIGVIVNSANPIKGLTKKQVEQIFTGDVTDWSAVEDRAVRSPSTLVTLRQARTPIQGVGDEEARLRWFAKDGRQRTNRGRSGQKSKRRRLCWHGLRQGWRRKSNADRWRSALDQKCAGAQLSVLATDILLHKRRPQWPGQGFCRFHSGPGGQRIVAQVGFVPIK